MYALKWLRTPHQIAKFLSTSCSTKATDFKELRIPVVHGHLAAKVWGDSETTDPTRRIIAIHGWQDNANSFNPLILHKDLGFHKFLNHGLCMACVDFSGHGLSSHLPPGSLYSIHSYTMDIFAVAKFFKWEKFSLLGHSMGGGLAFHTALVAPERVQKLAAVDATFPFWSPRFIYDLSLGGAYAIYERFAVEYSKNKSLPQREFTHDEYFEALRRASALMYPDSPEGSVSEENSLLLLERGSTPTSDKKFILNRDPNTRAFFPEVFGTSELALRLDRFEKEVEMLFLRPEQGIKVFEEIYETLAEHAPENVKSFEILPVSEATHHVHMDQPEKILPKLTDFLLK